MPSENITKHNINSNFSEKDGNSEIMSDENSFEGLTKEWKESDPSSAPLLSELNQNREKQQIYNSKEIKNVILEQISVKC